MRIEKVSRDIFPEINLDHYKREQKVTRIYVKKEDTYELEEQPGVMDWSIDKKREVAQDLIDSNYISFLALEEDRVVGFVSLVKELAGERMVLDMMQVDADFRGQGIGRVLWDKAVEEARLHGAKEMYISACPSEETIHFYKAMGAEITNSPIRSIADEEPYDLQMVCQIG
jgi:GNAT superfamily N-acetyltransferase